MAETYDPGAGSPGSAPGAGYQVPVAPPSGPSPGSPYTPPSQPVPGQDPPADPLADYRDHFARSDGLYDALKATMGHSNPTFDDATMAERLAAANQHWQRTVPRPVQERARALGLDNDPHIASWFASLATEAAQKDAYIAQLEGRLKEMDDAEPVYRGRRGTAAEGQEYSEHAMDDELDRVRALYLDDKQPYERRQSAFRRLEKLQRMKFER